MKVPGAGGANQSTSAARFIGHSGLPTEPTLGPSASLADAHRRRPSVGGAKAAQRKGRGDLTLGELEEAHAALCKRVGVAGYSAMEFATAADVLCTLGLVELGGGGGGERRRQRVALRVAEDDVFMALADVPVLRDVVGA